MQARVVLAALVDLVLPDRCPGCGRPAAPPACPDCLRRLHATPRPCPPDPTPAGLPVPWAVAAYDGPVRALVLAHKERGRLALARWFGAALARAALAAADGGGPIVLVPVPSSSRARRGRGHDPVLRTARAAAATLRATGVTATVVPLLRHQRRVADQAGLDSASRHANLAGAYIARSRQVSRLRQRLARIGQPARSVVVDDVVTTGATLLEAVRAAQAVGFTV